MLGGACTVFREKVYLCFPVGSLKICRKSESAVSNFELIPRTFRGHGNIKLAANSDFILAVGGKDLLEKSTLTETTTITEPFIFNGNVYTESPFNKSFNDDIFDDHVDIWNVPYILKIHNKVEVWNGSEWIEKAPLESSELKQGSDDFDFCDYN